MYQLDDFKQFLQSYHYNKIKKTKIVVQQRDRELAVFLKLC